MSDVTVNKLVEDVSYLKQDMAKVGVLVDRLDVTIDKLTEVSSSVSKLLAVHEMKLASQEITQKETIDLVEKRRQETETKVELLHARISSGEREIKQAMEEQYDEIMSELKEMRKEASNQHKAMNDRISKMEKWMWTVVGGAIVIGFIFQRIPWTQLFS